MIKNLTTYNAQTIDENGKLYKNKNVHFNFYESKYFEKNIKNNDEIVIVGEVNLNKKYKYDDKKSIAELSLERNVSNDTVDERPFLVNVHKLSNASSVGYIYIGDNQYVKIVKSTSILPIILGGIGIGLIAAIVYLSSTGDTPPPVTENNTPKFEIDNDVNDWDGDLTQNQIDQIKEQENTVIPGYMNLYVSDQYPLIKLSNPEENTVYFRYLIYNTKNDELLIETALIPNGKVKEVDFNALLSKGVHTLKFVIECYDLETQAKCNGANQIVSITVN